MDSFNYTPPLLFNTGEPVSSCIKMTSFYESYHILTNVTFFCPIIIRVGNILTNAVFISKISLNMNNRMNE